LRQALKKRKDGVKPIPQERFPVKITVSGCETVVNDIRCDAG